VLTSTSQSVVSELIKENIISYDLVNLTDTRMWWHYYPQGCKFTCWAPWERALSNIN